jgi:hypothetical protein
VASLRYSRASFRFVVWKFSHQIWVELHERAFRYFGGCPQYVVLGNLKEDVIKPDLHEPELNRVYAATLMHHGVVADPARVASICAGDYGVSTRERPRPASDRTPRLRSTRPVGHSRSAVASTQSGLLEAPSHRPQSIRYTRRVVGRKILHFEKLTENLHLSHAYNPLFLKDILFFRDFWHSLCLFF